MAIGYRRQQLVYGTTLLLSVAACASSGLIGRFDDIDFSDASKTGQLISLVTASHPIVYTNGALAAFSFVLLISDMFRSSAIPVWFELAWTFVFGTLEIVNTVFDGTHYPTSHCQLATSSRFRRRDTVEGSSEGSILQYHTAENHASIVEEASNEICTNWALIFVLCAMLAMMLFAQLSWLTLMGLRHRYSHPSFWTSETPAPFSWHLTSVSDEQPRRPADLESIASSNDSMYKAPMEEKSKDNTTAAVVVLPPLAPLPSERR